MSRQQRMDAGTGGLASAATGDATDQTGPGGEVPVRTDDAVGASDQIRANAVTVAPISDRTRAEAREIMTRYPRARSALLPMLHLVQSEQGYVTPDGVRMCAEELGLTKAEVGAVATFYTMYKRRPTGDYLISVCTNTLCGFLGGEEIFDALKDHLGVGHNQTTADGQITLEHAECLAACDYAPVLTVNYEFYDQQDTSSALGLVQDLQQGRRPAPTRGAPLCSFKEISRELAGFYDPERDRPAVDGPSAGEPTVAGMRVAEERGHESPSFDASTPVVPAPPADSVTQDPAAATAPHGTAAQSTAAQGTAGQGTAPAAQSSEPADPTPADGQTAHQTSTDKAVAASDTPAEAAGAKMADPDTNEQTLAPSPDVDDVPRTPAAEAAPATGAPTGPQTGGVPRGRRTRTRARSGGQDKIPTETDRPRTSGDQDGRS